jgi:5-methylcytosine-specific restriction endonuclease McrA
MITQATPCFARELVDRLSSRLQNEKRELVMFLVELADFDARKLALELGYPSTLSCLVRELGLTESSACRRITAARLLARFPQIAPYLLSSRITLVGLIVLKDALDETNVDELLERAAGLNDHELRQLVATAPAATVAADRVATSQEEDDLEVVTLRVGREFREELAAVSALLSHAVPSGKREDVLLHVLRAQRRVLERRRHGSPKRASAPAACDTSKRHIPAAVRREVFEREGGSCAYVGDEGRRCGSTVRLEYQHIVPFACGGPSSAKNLTLFCQPHNLLQAEKDFGEEHITSKRAVSALIKLGYSRKQAEQAVQLASQQRPRSDLATLVRESLRVAEKP